MARTDAPVRSASLAIAAFMAGTAAVALAQPAPHAASPAAHSAHKPAPQFQMAVPQGFEDLAREQDAVVDVFMGGRQVATTQVRFGPGTFRFTNPAALVATLPHVTARDRVLAALSAPALIDNRARACRDRADGAACMPLRVEVAGIVFDESRFRVEVFVAAELIATRAAVSDDYLPEPVGSLAVSQALGLTVAGTTGASAQLSLTDSLLVGLGPARLRADLGWQTDQRAYADTLALELDRREHRLTAGLLWAPGTEFTGRRKLVGVSLATQFDTRLDRDQIQGTPLVVHLDERARVDVYVGGRLVLSGLYEAGNQALDTSGMPEGSYEVMLRITNGRGGAREERRMFTRSPALPPLGHDAWSLTGGALVDESRGGFPLSAVTRTPYVQAGWLHRLSSRWALGLGLVATDQRQMLNARALLAGRRIVANANLVVSARGDFGAYARLGSQPGGRLSFELDARAVSTRDGRPLLPDAGPVQVWIGQQPQLLRASSHETEFSGNVAYQLGRTRIAIAGNWRRADGQRQYAIGPSAHLPLLRRDTFELIARGDYAFTERGRSGYLGLTLTLTRGNKMFSAEGGASGAPGDLAAAVGNLRATVTGDTGLGQVQGSAALGHDQNATYATADLLLRADRGEASASLTRTLGGDGRTQYALSLRTGLAAARGHVALGRLDGGESGVVARVDAPEDERFELLVNDMPRALLRGGHTVTIDLPAYRSYDVRLRAAAGSMLGYDGAARRVTLFPGNVAAFAWRTRPQLAIYARLVSPDGTPLAAAALTAGSNIAETGSDGGFLMQLDAERTITARLLDGSTCVTIVSDTAEREGKHGFAALQDLVCARKTMTSRSDKFTERQP